MSPCVSIYSWFSLIFPFSPIINPMYFHVKGTVLWAPSGPGTGCVWLKIGSKMELLVEPEIHSKVSERIMALFVDSMIPSDSRILMGAGIFCFLSKEIDPGSNQGWFNRIWGIANPGCKTSKNMFNMFHLGYTQTSLCLVGRQLFLCKINQKSRRHPTFYLLTSRISAASSHISNPLCAKQRLYNASQLMCASPERIGKPGNARKT